MYIRIITLLSLIIMAASCVPVSEMAYLQTDKAVEDQEYEVKYDDYVVGYNDILHVQITIKEEQYLEQPNRNYASDASFFLSGYTVDKNGYIELPILGEVYVFGSTIAQIKDRLSELLSSYYTKYVVRVKPNGVKITILGEVNRPGAYTFYQNNVTIFHLIASSGDLSTFANRKQIKILRHTDDNVKVHYLDLTNQDIFTSDFYYLQPEDVIYVEPLGVKTWGIGTTGFSSVVTITSIISSIFLVVNVISRS